MVLFHVVGKCKIDMNLINYVTFFKGNTKNNMIFLMNSQASISRTSICDSSAAPLFMSYVQCSVPVLGGVGPLCTGGEVGGVQLVALWNLTATQSYTRVL